MNISPVEFKPWPKTPRHRGRTCTITEKIDGTNGCLIVQGGTLVGVQSRNKLLTVEDDNFGFCNWAYQNRYALGSLFEGYHYGEWAGPGIQGNPLKLERKEFFLFTPGRNGFDFPYEEGAYMPSELRLVPVLYHGEFYDGVVEDTMKVLWQKRQWAGLTPEGVIVYDHSTKARTKATFKSKH